MDIMPMNYVVLAALPQAIMTAFLGLYLLGVKPSTKRVVLAGFVHVITLYFFKRYTGYGINFILQTIAQVIITVSIVKVTPLCSLISNLIATAINILLETANLIIFLRISQYTYAEIISRPWLRVFYTLPKLVVLFFILGICIKFNVTLEEEISFVGKINREIKL